MTEWNEPDFTPGGMETPVPFSGIERTILRPTRGNSDSVEQSAWAFPDASDGKGTPSFSFQLPENDPFSALRKLPDLGKVPPLPELPSIDEMFQMPAAGKAETAMPEIPETVTAVPDEPAPFANPAEMEKKPEVPSFDAGMAAPSFMNLPEEPEEPKIWEETVSSFANLPQMPTMPEMPRMEDFRTDERGAFAASSPFARPFAVTQETPNTEYSAAHSFAETELPRMPEMPRMEDFQTDDAAPAPSSPFARPFADLPELPRMPEMPRIEDFQTDDAAPAPSSPFARPFADLPELPRMPEMPRMEDFQSVQAAAPAASRPVEEKKEWTVPFAAPPFAFNPAPQYPPTALEKDELQQLIDQVCEQPSDDWAEDGEDFLPEKEIPQPQTMAPQVPETTAGKKGTVFIAIALGLVLVFAVLVILWHKGVLPESLSGFFDRLMPAQLRDTLNRLFFVK